MDNARCSHPPHSRHLKIGTTAIRMAGTLTTPTPARRVVTQGSRTTQREQGQIRWEATRRAYTGWFCLPLLDTSHLPHISHKPCPYNVAEIPTSREFYSDEGGDTSDDAGNPLPGHQPVWTSPSAVRTSSPCCRTACAPSRTSCGNDNAVLQTIPAASKLLMVRGKRS